MKLGNASSTTLETVTSDASSSTFNSPRPDSLSSSMSSLPRDSQTHRRMIKVKAEELAKVGLSKIAERKPDEVKAALALLRQKAELNKSTSSLSTHLFKNRSSTHASGARSLCSPTGGQHKPKVSSSSHSVAPKAVNSPKKKVNKEVEQEVLDALGLSYSSLRSRLAKASSRRDQLQASQSALPIDDDDDDISISPESLLPPSPVKAKRDNHGSSRSLSRRGKKKEDLQSSTRSLRNRKKDELQTSQRSSAARGRRSERSETTSSSSTPRSSSRKRGDELQQSQRSVTRRCTQREREDEDNKKKRSKSAPRATRSLDTRPRTSKELSSTGHASSRKQLDSTGHASPRKELSSTAHASPRNSSRKSSMTSTSASLSASPPATPNSILRPSHYKVSPTQPMSPPRPPASPRLAPSTAYASPQSIKLGADPATLVSPTKSFTSAHSRGEHSVATQKQSGSKIKSSKSVTSPRGRQILVEDPKRRERSKSRSRNGGDQRSKSKGARAKSPATKPARTAGKEGADVPEKYSKALLDIAGLTHEQFDSLEALGLVIRQEMPPNLDID